MGPHWHLVGRILKDLGSRKNLTTIAEVGLAAISISDRAQFVREIFSSAISRRNRVPPEYRRKPHACGFSCREILYSKIGIFNF